ncbi:MULTISPECIES: cytochrome P450 [unclassified Actinotalea]|uniref:cytochrome P450 n=1 Tax=unclassified Actinotalea TaxID=2638618 RepID=UPI001C7154D3|nr:MULTISPECIES: cytochrome P450 [unclassified Actinotalea]
MSRPDAAARTAPLAHAMAWEERVQRGAHPVVYPFLRRVAARGPVVRVPGLGVVVSDAALAREVLLDTERFTKTGPGSPADLWTPVLGPAVLLNMEGDDHARLRGRLAPLFTPRAVADLTGPVLAGPTERLGERLAAGAHVDLVAHVGAMAGAVICRMTGLPATDAAVRSAFRDAQEIVGMVRLHRRTLTPPQVRRAREVLGRLSAHAVTAYRAGDEATVPGRMRALGLSESEARGAVGAFVLTGTETLVSFVPRLAALLADTGWDARLAAADDAGLAGKVVSEALRITAPTPAMLRSVEAAGDVGGVRVAAGDRVVIATLLACRGAGPFAPDVPQPAAVRQLWFGAGPHFCLGMPLAMVQTTAVLDALLAAVRSAGPLRVVERRVARGVLIPAYAHLAVGAGPRREADAA